MYSVFPRHEIASELARAMRGLPYQHGRVLLALRVIHDVALCAALVLKA